jgi:HSP20 family protein
MSDETMTRTDKDELAGAEATRPGRLFTPAVDISETEAAITILADMPGVKPDGLSIDLEEGVLTIDGTVSEDPEGEDVLLREYEVGAFHRRFRLSNAIDQEKIDAALKDGVLTLTLPKTQAHRPRKIEVKVG